MKKSEFMHRDLKPQNIFVNLYEEDKFSVLLADFDSSRNMTNSSELSTAFFTACYQPPERKEYSFSFDLW
jgi:serine/threonine protein kinase